MSHVVLPSARPSSYVDRKWKAGEDDYKSCIKASSTVYVGNLSFGTTEEQAWQVFSQCGEIKRLIMGINRHTRTPCGFCFVEYYRREDAQDAINFLNKTKVDGRIVRIDMDPGFRPGRQFGRGQSGYQVRDEQRDDNDPGRGGTANDIMNSVSQKVNRAYQRSNYFHADFGSGGYGLGYDNFNPNNFDNSRLFNPYMNKRRNYGSDYQHPRSQNMRYTRQDDASSASKVNDEERPFQKVKRAAEDNPRFRSEDDDRRDDS